MTAVVVTERHRPVPDDLAPRRTRATAVVEERPITGPNALTLWSSESEEADIGSRWCLGIPLQESQRPLATERAALTRGDRSTLAAVGFALDDCLDAASVGVALADGPKLARTPARFGDGAPFWNFCPGPGIGCYSLFSAMLCHDNESLEFPTEECGVCLGDGGERSALRGTHSPRIQDRVHIFGPALGHHHSTRLAGAGCGRATTPVRSSETLLTPMVPCALKSASSQMP
jgi:hypothetical protein